MTFPNFASFGTLFKLNQRITALRLFHLRSHRSHPGCHQLILGLVSPLLSILLSGRAPARIRLCQEFHFHRCPLF